MNADDALTTDITVRFFDLDAVTLDEGMLSDSERERVARKATPTLRQRQAASFQCLRSTLGEVLGLAPRDVGFHVEDSGKPVLVGHALHFNLSHSAGIGMLAWGPRELGADVEALIARPTDALAEEILSTRELALWRAMPGSERQAWLTRAWTRKESTLKAIGSGLRIPPRTIDVQLAGDPIWTCTRDGRRWTGRDVVDGVPEGYRAALCTEAPRAGADVDH